jgi:predicted nucleic acid-binding protein
MPVLFDTSIYIAALSPRGNPSPIFERWTGESPLWLSAVVLEELYAGAVGTGARAVERLERDFERARRVLVPNLSDWACAGKVLSRLARKYGYEQIGRARLTNDALIAMSAARTGVTVLTANSRDFARIAEFRAFSWHTHMI